MMLTCIMREGAVTMVEEHMPQHVYRWHPVLMHCTISLL
jgi:hypothetical protein